MSRKSKILIADDEPQFLKLLEKYLDSMNCDVIAKTGGRKALNAAVLEKPDVIILDVMMPDLDGIETTYKLKEMEFTRDIPIIIITGLDSSEDRIRAFKAGANDYISKPLNFLELKTRVSAQLKIKKYYDHIAQYNQALENEVMRRTEQLRRSIQDVNQFSEAAHKAGLARAEFLSNMSHEIRTPLNGIIGMAHLVIDTDLDQEQKDYIETIIDSSRNLLNIINDTLDFSDIEHGRITLTPEPFKLREWFEDILSMMRAKAMDKGLSVKSKIAANIPDNLVGDAHRLRQVVVNLAGNAIKFTDQGHISLDISAEELSSHKVVLTFTFTDTGIGIDSKKQQMIFDAFTQSDQSSTRKKGGIGLGLTISDRIVKLMGGEIKIVSESERGSLVSFTVELMH